MAHTQDPRRGDESELMFGLEEEEATRAAPTRRTVKTNANHLLRFRSKPRPDDACTTHSSSSAKKKSHTQQQKKSYGAFETPGLRLFVSDDGESGATPFATDADAAVDWGAVCAVTSSERLECPICLDALRAPVSTKCGHVFCAGCVVTHARAFEFSRSKRCPCCNAFLDATELRPFVVSEDAKEEHVFALLERRKSRRTAWLFGETPPDGSLPRSFEAPFSKLALCDDDASSAVFRATLDATQDDAAYAVLDAVFAAFVARRAVVVAAAADEGQRRRQQSPRREEVSSLTTEEEKTFVLYGDARGRARFLHPLALRCLLKAVDGDAAKLPRFLRWRPRRRHQEEERFEQCGEARKRLPWLAHLQLGTDVTLCDVDLLDLHADDDDSWGSRAAAARQADPTLKAAFEARDARRKREKEKSKRQDKKLRRAQRDKDRQKLSDARRRPVRDAAPLERFYADRGRFELNDDDFAPLTSSSPPQHTTEVIAGTPPSDEPSFATLVSRGFAAELGCPALGSSPPLGSWGPKLGAEQPSSSPWGASSATTPRTVCWGKTASSSSSKPPPPATPQQQPQRPRQQQAAPATPLPPPPGHDDGLFAPPPASSYAVAIDAALKEKQSSASASSSKKTKRNRGATLSLTAGGRGRY